MAVRLFDKRAGDYQDKYMDVGLYADTLDLFCDHIVINNAEILEVACGPGNITRYMLQKRPDLKWLGTDLAPAMLELAAKNNPGASFRSLDGRDIHTLNRQFDGVVCGFFLPYLSKPEVKKFIRDAAGVLRNGGLLYLSTMEDDYGRSGFQSSGDGLDRIYIHYHEGHYLAEFLHDGGLKVLDVQRKDFKQADGSFTTDLIITAKKTMVHGPLSMV